MPVPKHCPLSRPCSQHAPPAPQAVIPDPWPNPPASGDPLPCSLPSPPSQILDQAQPHGQQDLCAWYSSRSSPYTRPALIKALG